MKILIKIISLCLFLLFSFTSAQNSDYEDYEENIKDTVVIDGAKYARVIDEEYFDDLEYEDRMWSFAPGYGFGLIKGSTFSTIPSGYSINIISPYGFGIGPFYYNISFALGKFEAEYYSITTDNIGITTGDTLSTVEPFYIGIGGDVNFLESVYSEGHIGRVGSGLGFRGFIGYDMGNLGSFLDNGLDINLMIGSAFYISSEMTKDSNPSYWATISLRAIYSFHSLFDS
tara:strand:+ start:992 stop:1678 length:687 start_codon:yes stop_codon:yes gene_type:complete